MDILSKITDAMQVVLSETANAIARKTGFIKRLKKLSGSAFVQTLVFGWLDNPDSTIEELTQTARLSAGRSLKLCLVVQENFIYLIIQNWV